MILFLKSIFKERIWGSHYFKDELNYALDDNLYGLTKYEKEEIKKGKYNEKD